MQIVKVRTKGQTTVSKLLREGMGLTESDTIAFRFGGGSIAGQKIDVSLLQQTHGVRHG